MNLADWVVVLVSAALLAVLGWFFFGPRRARAAEMTGGVQRVAVRVRGGYSPDVIRLKQGVAAELVFDRQESGDCTSRVVFPDLRLSAALPSVRAHHGPVHPGACGVVRLRLRDEHDPRHGAGGGRRRSDGYGRGTACGGSPRPRSWPRRRVRGRPRRRRRRRPPSGGRRSGIWRGGWRSVRC